MVRISAPDMTALIRSVYGLYRSTWEPMKVYDYIGSALINLNKLAATWPHGSIKSEEFLTQFRCELESLETKVNGLVNSIPSSNTITSALSLTKL